MRNRRKKIILTPEEEDLGKGNLFATGLVAGGALFGVIAAILTVFFEPTMNALNLEHNLSVALGQEGYFILGTLFFAFMGFVLYRIAISKKKNA